MNILLIGMFVCSLWI